jgi:hypothetical protein
MPPGFMVLQTGGRQSRPQVLPPVPENAGELAHANVLRDIDTYFVRTINSRGFRHSYAA